MQHQLNGRRRYSDASCAGLNGGQNLQKRSNARSAVPETHSTKWHSKQSLNQEQKEVMTEFEYIRSYYRVPAETYREVVVNGRKGVITEAMGSYIGVRFYDSPQTHKSLPCHPTWKVEYLEINPCPPNSKVTRAKRRAMERYRDFLASETELPFIKWLKLK